MRVSRTLEELIGFQMLRLVTGIWESQGSIDILHSRLEHGPRPPTFHHTDKPFAHSAASLSSLTTVAIKSVYVYSGLFEAAPPLSTMWSLFPSGHDWGSNALYLSMECIACSLLCEFLLSWPLHISACEMKWMHDWILDYSQPGSPCCSWSMLNTAAVAPWTL